MRWLLGLCLLMGCHDSGGLLYGQRVRPTEGLFRGCIGVVRTTLWDSAPMFHTTCIVRFGPGQMTQAIDCYKLEAVDGDQEAFIGCPKR